jgi:hypothetical protein
MVLDGLGFATCCEAQMVRQKSTGNFKEDVKQYYTYCRKLREDLNNGKPTSCTGCYMLHDGCSEDDLRINTINLSTGLPGGDHCNFKCCYCTYGEDLGACSRDDNVWEIIQQIGELLEIRSLTYNCGEITVSPYRHEILRYWRNRKWKGKISNVNTLRLYSRWRR